LASLAPSRAPAAPLTREQKLALAGICSGYFLVILDAIAVNMALPSIGRDLDASLSTLQWIVDSYLLVFAALMLAGGRYADRFGPRRVFLVGLTAFGVASVACALAPSSAALVGARSAQGAAAALMLPGSLAYMRQVIPDPATRSRALAAWTIAGALGGMSGPALGGILVGAVGWPMVFLLNVPAVAAGAWLTLRSGAVGTVARNARGTGIWGPLLATAAVLGLTMVIIESPGGLHKLTVGGVALLLVAGGSFAWHELRGRRPLLPPTVIAQPSVRAAAVIGLVFSFDALGTVFVLSLYLQDVRGYEPLAAGLAFVPQPVATALGAWLIGRRRRPPLAPRAMFTAGLLAAAAGTLGIAAVADSTPYWWIGVMVGLVGLGGGLTVGLMNDVVLAAVPGEESGLASALLNAARQLGVVLGIALLGALAATAASLEAGVRVAALAALAVTLGGLAAVRGIPRHAPQ